MNDFSLISSESSVTFLAIASGKGGVGKSTVTVNVAAALQRLGKRVGIMDADIYGFSIPSMLGIKEGLRKEQNQMYPIEHCGLQVMSTGFFVPDNNPVMWRGPMLGKMLSTFFNDVKWAPLDYMIIDLPPGTGDVALSVHHKIPQSAQIIVTTPSDTASHVAARAGKMALQTNHRILGVVENMSYFEDPAGEKHFIFGQGGGARLAEQLETKLLAQIQITPFVQEPAESVALTSIYPPETNNGILFTELAAYISGQKE
ncbi:Mrp/NBP35 family ATP-binding protein [uncultured Brevibacillus sp.]|uniref:Mrp/NBP35 family ATP-binding protein n=1 Tax=uncultured Brevibacillus sp. TaxID=169970 RepID=UPI0025961DB0|nr:Mrp/NBP35 family ATP-binding protein [uncultured Brevibacillus sp.]